MVQKQKNARNKRPTKRFRASHLKASLTYVASHRHTGRRLHARHTSHGFLLILLIAVGLILFFNLATLRASGITSSSDVNVTLTVPGPAPTEGAVINSLPASSTVKKPLLIIDGTCPVGTLVVIYNNGQSAGSTMCAPGDIFQLTIQLQSGTNVLQAQNYDNLNQPGPVTGQFVVVFDPDFEPAPQEVNSSEEIIEIPLIPEVYAPQPSESSCFALVDPESTTELRLLTPCITRNIVVGQKFELLVIIAGGTSPYALSVDWGDGEIPQLYSFDTSGSHTVSHTYAAPKIGSTSKDHTVSSTYVAPKIKSVTFRVVDASGQTYQLQTVVDVVDHSSAVTGVNPVQGALNSLSSVWLEASVPVYWTAVSLFGGFWIGELFQRFLGFRKPIRRHS